MTATFDRVQLVFADNDAEVGDPLPTFAAWRDSRGDLFLDEGVLDELRAAGWVDAQPGGPYYPDEVLHPGEYAGLFDIREWDVVEILRAKCAVCGIEVVGDSANITDHAWSHNPDPAQPCEGYNVAGRWVDCDRVGPHDHDEGSPAWGGQ